VAGLADFGGRYRIPGAYTGRISDPIPDTIPGLRYVLATISGNTAYYGII
jgi:hypothetical protein